MSTHQYTRQPAHGGLQFASEVETALPGKAFVVHCSGTDCNVVFEDELTAGEITTLDAAVAAFTGFDELKKGRIGEIDAKTSELISGGFTHDSVQISLSINSQTRIHGAYTARAGLAYPIEWNSIDDTALLSLADATEVEAFFSAALVALRGHIDSGTTLKTAVRDATTTTELDAVVDSR